MSSPRDATPVELRRAIEEALAPERLVIKRDHAGALSVRILSEAFEGVADPLAKVEEVLQDRGLRLPERTLTILKAPGELEDEDEKEFFFSQQWKGTPNWGDALLLERCRPIPRDDRGFEAKIVAFWGLKGGVGRSTALAHAAAILGQRKRVLAIDLDLESPALVATLAGNNHSGNGIRIEKLVRAAADANRSDDDLQDLIRRALHRSSDRQHSIEVLGPEIADTAYVLDLLGPLAPAALYRGGQPVLRRLVSQAIRATDAELVLLDARSGYCDDSAMSVLDLADEVVLFASPAPSTFPSLAPAVEALERNRQALGRPRIVYIVASMLPAGDQARERILETLRETLESAQLAVSDILETPDDERPPEIAIIEVDYSSRIVENEGTLLLHASDGYREIAERICPAPLPASVTAVEEGWVNEVLREARIPVTQAEDEPEPEKLAELFTRTPDLAKFARQDICLVLGAKGTGKSFLRRMCLEHRDLLVQRSGVKALAGVTFIDGYSQPCAGSTRQPPRITPDLLRQIDQQLGEQWSHAWSALALGRALGQLGDLVSEESLSTALAGHPRTHLGQLQRLAGADSSKKVLAEVKKLIKDPLALDDAWQKLDRWCEEIGKTLILLFDELDVALGETPRDLDRRDAMVRGLLDRANASWISRRHLGVKIFLREDIFRSLGSQEEAKYDSRSVHLHWRPEDMWRLIIRAMALASSRFRSHIEGRGLDLEHLEDAPEEDWRDALELIWGERLGVSESNTRSVKWAHRRLRDSRGRMFPRAALWLLQYALEQRRSSLSKHSEPPLLDAPSLRRAMPHVAQQRLAELRAESTRQEKERLQRLKGLTHYQNERDFLAALDYAGESEPKDTLAVFKSLGLAESGRRRDGTPTVRIVDLYAFATELEIERKGRRIGERYIATELAIDRREGRQRRGRRNGERYLGNSNNKEVHDLDNEKLQCWIDKIKEEHKVWFKTLNAAENAGYDHCGFCLGGSRR